MPFLPGRACPAAVACLFAPALLAFACPSHALTTRCVGSAAQLAAALVEASQGSADSPFVIRIREGAYASDGATGPFRLAQRRSGQLVELSGGWSGAGGTCQTKSFDPSRTTLAGGANRQALYFSTSELNTLDNLIYVHDLTLTNASFAEVASGACLAGNIKAGNAAVLDRVHARDCQAPVGEHASIYVYHAGDLTMRNVAASAGSAANNGGIGIYTYGNGVSRLAQITVTGTRSSGDPLFGSGIALINFDNALTHIANSVSWGNDPDADIDDIWVHGFGIVLTRVHYGRMEGVPDANLVPGSGDPAFVAPGDPHLRSDSALIDSGVSDPHGGSGTFDADGRARVQGSAVDVGAYEAAHVSDSIFANGFEPANH